jgi:hypothetical protein
MARRADGSSPVIGARARRRGSSCPGFSARWRKTVVPPAGCSSPATRSTGGTSRARDGITSSATHAPNVLCLDLSNGSPGTSICVVVREHHHRSLGRQQLWYPRRSRGHGVFAILKTHIVRLSSRECSLPNGVIASVSGGPQRAFRFPLDFREGNAIACLATFIRGGASRGCLAVGEAHGDARSRVTEEWETECSQRQPRLL